MWAVVIVRLRVMTEMMQTVSTTAAAAQLDAEGCLQEQPQRSTLAA